MKMRHAQRRVRTAGCVADVTSHRSRNTQHVTRIIPDLLPVTSLSAFTMIEIAISLAVIGFALVAIIGILPIGMNVQKENRQETIITQDANIFMDAIRNGAQGGDDLTNYVLSITNYQVHYSQRGNVKNVYAYTFTNSTINGALANPQMPITNGFRIIGLLSTPKIATTPGVLGFFSNHVVAYVRSISGPASEKFPQTSPTVQDFGLTYRLVSDVGVYWTNYYDTNWFALNVPGLTTNDYAARVNYSNIVNQLQANLHDIRLTFRWPLLPNGNLPQNANRQIFRSMVAGQLMVTNDHGFPVGLTNLYFFQPRRFVQ
jgi:type II secretory pathway pseudopilin PulG